MTADLFKLSVIIPTYNNVSLFKKALNSVLQQTLLPYEIIVTDDSSTGEIEDLCRNIANPLIKYFRNKPSLGAVNNWNSGINKVKGNWVLILHHDEELRSKDYLEELRRLSEESDLIISEIKVRTELGERSGRITGVLKKLFLKIPALNYIFNSIGPCACVTVKRSIVEQFNNKLVWLVDTEWYYRLLRKAHKVAFNNDLFIVSNHGHEGQITKNIDVKDKEKRDINTIKELHEDKWDVAVALSVRKIISKIIR